MSESTVGTTVSHDVLKKLKSELTSPKSCFMFDKKIGVTTDWTSLTRRARCCPPPSEKRTFRFRLFLSPTCFEFALPHTCIMFWLAFVCLFYWLVLLILLESPFKSFDHDVFPSE